jgi:hypothetical protein
MINKVRIVLVNNRGCDVKKATQMAYPCTFEYQGKIRMITDSGQYKEINAYDAHPPKALLVNFSKTSMFVEYAYEADKNKQNEDDKNKQKIIELFWGKNPICLNNGSSHDNLKVGDQFDMINENTKTVAATTQFKDILRAANKLSSMTHANRLDVAYFYGISPVGKSEEELLVTLADMTPSDNGSFNGFCLKAENINEFLRIWVDGKSEDTATMVVLKKAIAHEIIKNRGKDGRSDYFLNDTFLGSDDTGLLDWTRKNEREYKEHILRVVNEKDVKTSKTPASLAKQETVNLSEIEKLKAQAKELKEEGFIDDSIPVHTMGIEKLKKAIEAAIEKKNAIPAE